MVKISKDMFWSKDFRKTTDINAFKLRSNSLNKMSFSNRDSIPKTNNRKKVSYDKFNNLGFYIMSIRYVNNTESHYVIVNKSKANNIKHDQEKDVIILKSCPTFIDIYVERLLKNDIRLEKIASQYDFDYIKTHEFYYIELVRNDGFEKEVEAKNILPA